MKIEKIIKNRNLIFLFSFIIFAALGYFYTPTIPRAAARLGQDCVIGDYTCLVDGDLIVVDLPDPVDPLVDAQNCTKQYVIGGRQFCVRIKDVGVSTSMGTNSMVYNWDLSSPPLVTVAATLEVTSPSLPNSSIKVTYYADELWDNGTYGGYHAVCDARFSLEDHVNVWGIVACFKPACYDSVPHTNDSENPDYILSGQCMSQGVAETYGRPWGTWTSTASFTMPLVVLRAGDQTWKNQFNFSVSYWNGSSWVNGPNDYISGKSLSISVKKYNYSVSPTSLTFNAEQNASLPASQPITVRNTSFGDLNISVSDNATWLTVTPISLSLPNAGDTTAVLASVNTANLSPGTYNAIITFNDPNVESDNNKTVNVSYTVASGATPALSAKWTENNLTSKTINTASPECTPGPNGSKNCTVPLNFWNSGQSGSSVNVELCNYPTPVGVSVNSVWCPPITLTNP